MGTSSGPEIDAWLRDGGIVVGASDRAARAIRSAFHRARRNEGLSAWAEPSIRDWRTFVRDAWIERSQDDRLLLNPAQEESLWSEIVAEDRQPATVLEGPRRRIAALAMEAHDLLASHAPQHLRSAARSAWQQDASAFSAWLSAFDDTCREGQLVSASRLPLELIPMLENSDSNERPPLLLAGFDRILPVQRRLLDAWGTWREATAGETATDVRFYGASDARSELTACALWCKLRLAAHPGARLLVITQDAANGRGEIERALLRQLPTAGAPLFEFTLGIPLSKVPLARSAHLLLRWLTRPLEENELDWLFSAGHIAGSPQESAALQRAMRALRVRGEERTHWTLEAFCRQRQSNAILPAPWIERTKEAQRRLASIADGPRSPIEWAELIPRLLKAAGWPGFRALTSAEFQAAQRWQQALEACASLGFDGRRTSWQEFFSALARALDETLFAPESRDAPIQVAGPAESAGLIADAIWFLDADEDAWPPAGSTHPFLPLQVQREAGMPHATPQLDWDLACAVTARLLASAPEVCFSFAQQKEGTDARPSRLISQLSAPPRPLPPELVAPASPPAITVAFCDASFVPFAPGPVDGGASVLTSQSQCPFKAFATVRLAAVGWQPAEAGLNPTQRGRLVHAVLHAIWGGPPVGIRTLDELLSLKDRETFVARHVQRVLREAIPAGVRERMPRRYLELEEKRLIRLVTEWLNYEAARIPFVIAETEAGRPINLAGLSFRVRLDRLDRLNDGSLLVIDYKTGTVSSKLWDLPRPDDVQLPLYAAFALDRTREPLGGLVFAKVQAGNRKLEMAGKVFSPAETLFHDLKGTSTLVKNALTPEQLSAWRETIEQLARDFIAGRAEADPRDYPKTCDRCRLQTLCRIHESPAFQEPGGSNSEEAGDE